MGPSSMPSVPLMVGCGISCTALLILLLIYAAFWRWVQEGPSLTHSNTTQFCRGPFLNVASRFCCPLLDNRIFPFVYVPVLSQVHLYPKRFIVHTSASHVGLPRLGSSSWHGVDLEWAKTAISNNWEQMRDGGSRLWQDRIMWRVLVKASVAANSSVWQMA